MSRLDWWIAFIAGEHGAYVETMEFLTTDEFILAWQHAEALRVSWDMYPYPYLKGA